MLEYYLRGKPVESVNIKAIAKKTDRCSGADIAFICEIATEKSLERAIASGKVEPITDKELKSALQEVRPSTSAWFETARNYAMFANSSGEFNDLVEYMKAHRI